MKGSFGNEGMFRAVEKILNSGVSGRTIPEERKKIGKNRREEITRLDSIDVSKMLKTSLERLSYRPQHESPCPICMSKKHEESRCPYNKKVPVCGVCGGVGHESRQCNNNLCIYCGSLDHSWKECDRRGTPMDKEAMLNGDWCFHCGGDHPSVLCRSLHIHNSSFSESDEENWVNPVAASETADTNEGYSPLIIGWGEAIKEKEILIPNHEEVRLVFSRPKRYVIK